VAEQVAQPATSAAASTAQATPQQLAADATRGWAELQRATDIVLPQLLNEAERINKATLRLLGG
jgi:hypothetical protein